MEAQSIENAPHADAEAAQDGRGESFVDLIVQAVKAELVREIESGKLRLDDAQSLQNRF